MRRRRLLTSSAALAGGLVASPAATACRLFPADVTERYLAFQGEEIIGWQRFDFRRESGRFVVESRIEMTYRSLGGVPVDYSLETEEVWRTGWLHELRSRIRIGGRTRWVTARRSDGAMVVETGGGRRLEFGSYVVPSNLWHRDTRLVDVLLDVEVGRLRYVKARRVADDVLEQDGQRIEASRYAIRGQIDRDAWYDANCALVRWALPLDGGARIEFEQQAP